MARFIDPIPVEKQPLESEHIQYDVVYRAMYNRNSEDMNNFLPTYIERKYKPESFFEKDQQKFSLSVFTNEEDLIATIRPNYKTWIKVIALAKGRTNIQKGISTKEQNGHVDYYLYDYLNNSPKEDFTYLKDIDKNNE